jgi:hypothetical protein
MRYRCLNHDCLKVVDATTGWIREPDGRVYCWECFDKGRIPPVGADAYADVGTEPEPAPKAEPKPRKPRYAISEVWD